MNRHMSESINSEIKIILEEKGKVIFKDTSYNCGLETVN